MCWSNVFRVFAFRAPSSFVAGNHELWTAGPDSYQLYHEVLPRRIRELGWHWLESEPFITRDLAIVGSIGWYDYSFAQTRASASLAASTNKKSPPARLNSSNTWRTCLNQPMTFLLTPAR